MRRLFSVTLALGSLFTSSLGQTYNQDMQKLAEDNGLIGLSTLTLCRGQVLDE